MNLIKHATVVLGASLLAASVTIAQESWTPGGDTAPFPPQPRSKKLPTVEEWNNMGPSARAYVDKAKAIAGGDVDLKFEVANVCAADGGSNKRMTYGIPDDPRLQPYPGPDPAVAMKPYKLFDNLWYFGTTDVGSFLLVTRDGYMLFDALNNAHEARDIIVGGMKSVGLDPTKIKIFVIGHNHLDHAGGAHYIQSTFHPKTIMSRDDWRVYFTTMANAAKDRSNRQAARLDDLEPMTHDTDAVDGMKVTLGGQAVTLYSLPGHTPGSLAMIMPTMLKGKLHPILVMAAANDIDNRSSFIGGYEHVWQVGLDANVEAVFHVHPNILMNTLANMKYDDEHPNVTPLWLYGVEKTRKYIEIQRACTQARMEILGW